jgi:hypothetical protein
MVSTVPPRTTIGRPASGTSFWLIVASCDRYFGYDKTVLEEARKKVKRVYLWTGETDGVVKESEATFEHLKTLGVKVKLNVAQGYGHERLDQLVTELLLGAR